MFFVLWDMQKSLRKYLKGIMESGFQCKPNIVGLIKERETRLEFNVKEVSTLMRIQVKSQ